MQKYSKTISSTALLGLLLSANSAVRAQQAGAAAEEFGLEEIVITAQKREQNLQDVGISVTAFSGDKLQQLGFNNALDIIKQTPGLNILSSSRSNTNVNIRGISQNDFADHLEGPVAVYADEGYLGSSGAINGQSFDLERVEVLRGPQGTLFGRNATGGLIHYISRAPTRETTGYFQLDVGSYSLKQFEGAIGGSLSDTLRARVSIAGINEDGYVKNLIGARSGNKNNLSGRLQFALDLTPTTELRLMFNGGANANEYGNAGQAVAGVATAQTNYQGRILGSNEVGVFTNQILGGTLPPTCPGCDIFGYKQPADPFTRASESPGEFNREFFHTQAKLTAKLNDTINFTSISDYLQLNKNNLGTDTDDTPTSFFQFGTYQKYKQVSQELRLDGQSDKLKWQTGLFYLNLKGQYRTTVQNDISVFVGAPICNLTTVPNFPPCPTIVGGVDNLNQNNYSVDAESYAVFGQADYAFTDSWSVTAGLRYTDDHKVNFYTWQTELGFPTVTYNPSTNSTADRHFRNISAKAELDWRPTDGKLVYASISRGHKGGNWAQPVFPPSPTFGPDLIPLFPHKQEVLTSYEIGSKNEFWNHKARFNVDAFFYDYRNYQAFSLVGLAQSIVNKDAEAWGGEAELVLAPIRGLEISFGASSMYSQVYDMRYPLPDGRSYTAELPFSSKFSWNGLIRYEWDMLGGKVAASTNFQSVGPHYFSVGNEPGVREDRYFQADARLSYVTADEHWNGALWVKNLSDEQYRTFALDLSAIGSIQQNFAPPRTFGVSFGYKF